MQHLIPILAALAFLAVVGGCQWWVLATGGADETAERVRREKSDDAERAASLKLLEKWREGR